MTENLTRAELDEVETLIMFQRVLSQTGLARAFALMAKMYADITQSRAAQSPAPPTS